MMKHTVRNIALSAALATLLNGCGQVEIEKVKNGTLKDYQQTTIGQAIESVLGDVEWNYFETEKGVKVVEAKGLPGKKTTYYMRGNGLFYAASSLPYPESFDSLEEQPFSVLEKLDSFCQNIPKVTIQFILHANSDEFEVGFCGLDDKQTPDRNDFVKHIYDNDVTYEPYLKEGCRAVKSELSKRLTTHDQKFKSVKIGEQIWMAENLNIETPNSFCYNDDPSNCTKYGRLYTWDAAQKVCPENWHLPSKKEWQTLQFNVVGFNHLVSDRQWGNDAQNLFGFSALPAGNKDGYGNYFGLNEHASIWSSTEGGRDEAFLFSLFKLSYEIEGDIIAMDKKIAASVRCIKGEAPKETEFQQEKAFEQSEPINEMNDGADYSQSETLTNEENVFHKGENFDDESSEEVNAVSNTDSDDQAETPSESGDESCWNDGEWTCE